MHNLVNNGEALVVVLVIFALGFLLGLLYK